MTIALKLPDLKKLQRKPQPAIGLEFSLHHLNMVQMTPSPSGSFQAAVSQRYSIPREQLLRSPKQLKKMLRNIFKKHPFQGCEINTILPSDQVRTLSLSYKLNANQSEEEAITALLAERIQENLDDLVIDYVPIRYSDNTSEHMAIAVVAQRQAVIDYLELLRHTGLTVTGLEIGQTAICRLITRLSENPISENSLIINFGSKRSYITMVSGRRLMFDHSMEFSESLLLQRLAGELDISIEQAGELMLVENNPELKASWSASLPCNTEARTLAFDILTPELMRLTEEINRALVFAASELHGQPIHQIYILGSLARWDGFTDRLNSLLKIPVKLPDPFSAFKAAPDTKGLRQELCIATGLALKEFDSHA